MFASFRRSASLIGALFSGVLAALSTQAGVRVALMDFSTDDNSYRSIQAAADFTSLVQIELKNESGIDWVERSQVGLVNEELNLVDLKAGGHSPLRRGRMLGADWAITGHFSSDDHSRATLSFQIIELRHADVMVENMVTLPQGTKEWTALEPSLASFAAQSLRALIAKAKESQAQATNQARVAFLFLADTTRSPSFGKGADVLPLEFLERLRRTVATNGQTHLIRFPKAYQSTDEAEMAVDGIIEPDQVSWNRIADLYVWGTYAVTNARGAGRLESRVDVTVNLWDGIAQPVTIKDSLGLITRENLAATQTSALIDRLVGQIVVRARPQRSEQDAPAVRQQIADSIVKTYMAMTGGNQSQPGLEDREKFVQAVHMLETACFFDPDNADARVLWVTCRYGWWIDFRHEVKNQFWSEWRRSRAWGAYVRRYGLKPGGVQLPFPYHAQGGVPAAYVRSLEEALALFPQWDSMEEAVQEMAEEDQSRRQGVHTALMEAEYHGFPRQMPAELTMNWKADVKRELAEGKKRVAEYSLTSVTNASLANASGRNIGSAPKPERKASLPQPAAAPVVQRPAPGASTMVPAPDWLKNHMAIYSMFRLYPPPALANEVKLDAERIQFPPRFEVKVVRQLAFHQNRLWILAMDERSSPTSASTPDSTGETLDERNRLWCLEPDGTAPVLFKADLLPARINSFLFQGDQLWLAGDAVGLLDLKQATYRQFGLADGFMMKGVESLTLAGGRMYAAGEVFKLGVYDPITSRWTNQPLPLTTFSHSTGDSYPLCGNDEWLGYTAGITLFRNLTRGVWTNLPAIKSARCFTAESSGFWIGAGNGLHHYATGNQMLQSWNSPVFIESPMIGLVGSAYFGGNPTLPGSRLEEFDGQIRSRLAKLMQNRKQAHAARKDRQEGLDPFHLSSRIPGEVSALVNDGDFLWVGAVNYFGSYLLLLHKPTLSLVASYTMGVRDRISSLAVSDTHVWVGTAYGDNSLIRLRKDSFHAVARSQWVNLAVPPAERERLVRTLSARDEAMYAFLAGHDEAVVQKLKALDPSKAGLEEMFLLAWSYDASGMDDPQKARTWIDAINARYPDSPWAKFASEAILENEAAHETPKAQALAVAQFDRNHDGRLDDQEKRELAKDPAFAVAAQTATDKQTQLEMHKIIQRYDANGDVLLDQTELENIRSTINALLTARREFPHMTNRNRTLDPLLSEKFPPGGYVLKRFDEDHNGRLDAEELGKLAAEMKAK